MLLSFFLRGLLIGFSIAAPVGPIGVLAIRRTLTLGWLPGLLTGLGAATADALYGCVAGFGLTAISDILVSYAFWLQVIGGAFLCYLGLKTFMAKPTAEGTIAPEQGAASFSANFSMYASTVFLTLTNPMTILSFAAVFVGLGLAANGNDYGTATILVVGVFLGSALWWLLLSSGASLLRSWFHPKQLRWLNRISGLILLTFGIIALSSAG